MTCSVFFSCGFPTIFELFLIWIYFSCVSSLLSDAQRLHFRAVGWNRSRRGQCSQKWQHSKICINPRTVHPVVKECCTTGSQFTLPEMRTGANEDLKHNDWLKKTWHRQTTKSSWGCCVFVQSSLNSGWSRAPHWIEILEPNMSPTGLVAAGWCVAISLAKDLILMPCFVPLLGMNSWLVVKQLKNDGQFCCKSSLS